MGRFNVNKPNGGYVVLDTNISDDDFAAMVRGTPIELTDADLEMAKRIAYAEKPTFISIWGAFSQRKIVLPCVMSTIDFNGSDIESIGIGIYIWIPGMGTSACVVIDYETKQMTVDLTP